MRTRIRILESGSVKKIHQTRNAKGFRIRTQSGSANHTKLKANASGSGFLNPDSGIFMRTPDSHRIHTIRYGPPPPDLIGLELLMYVRVTRHLDHPWEAGNAMPCSRTMPSRSGKSQTCKHHVYHYHLTVNSPEPTRHGRASIPVRLAGLGFSLRVTRCRVWDFNADKPEFLDADKNLKA